MTAYLKLRSLGLQEGGATLLAPLSLSFTARRTVILGPNGAGKSTLLRLIHGLLRPSSGEAFWPSPLRQAMVFQRPVMLRRSTLANAAYGLHLQGLRGQQRDDAALAALRRVGLEGVAHRQARVLSGGEQQRVALARAWALQPEVLLLDEPTASLDPASRREVERVIGDIAATGTRILMTTHNLGQAKRLADEVVFLDSGHLVEQTPATEFFTEPRSPAGQAFIADLG